MKNLFLIDGASGTGKSELLSHILNTRTDSIYINKYTTRQIRQYEIEYEAQLDLVFISKPEFNELKLDYKYNYYGFLYGFRQDKLNEALRQNNNVFLIVRNADVIRQLLNDYRYINVVPVFVYTDQERLEHRLRKQGHSEEGINFRLSRIQLAYEDYLRHPQIYDEVLINNSTVDNYHRLIDLLIEKYEHYPKVDDNLIFVLMSFNQENQELKRIFSAMEKSVKDAVPEYKCLNLEGVKGKSFKISETAKDYIRKCRLAIIDLTENKPNVFYEFGFADGIAKDFIITAKKGTDLLFYPREYKIVLYEDAFDLQVQLTELLKATLRH